MLTSWLLVIGFIPHFRLEERPVSDVSGSGSAEFRAAHYDIPCGLSYAPSPASAALFQGHFKNGKLIRHRVGIVLDFLCGRESERVR